MKKSITIIFILSLIFLLKSNNLVAGQLYKWVDENGVKHFSDSPTDRDALEKGNSETMPAFERIEPVSQIDEVTEKDGGEGDQTDHADTASAIKIYNSMAREINTNINKSRGFNNAASLEKTQIVKNSNDYENRVKNPKINQAGNMRQKSILRKNNFVPDNRANNNIENERKRKEYEKKKLKIEQHNAKIAAENEKRRREYKKNKKKIEKYNQRAKDQNEQVEKRNQQIKRARYIREKEKAEKRNRKRRDPRVNHESGRKLNSDDSYVDIMRN